MNPVIVIPSYWAESKSRGLLGERGSYDYSTPITKPLPELEICLSSLEQVRGVDRVIVLLVAAPSCAASARARVDSICRSHMDLNPIVIGDEEAAAVKEQCAGMSAKLQGDPIALRGYGAIRNMGLAVASAFGHDAVVFLDDDEVALNEDYLIDAVYGLDSLTRQDLPILAKSGCYVDVRSSPYAPVQTEWCERLWSKHVGFNEMMKRYLTSPTRILRSSYLCGGCCSIHASAFTRVPFDPYITRGEDLDYLLDLRANGIDVWFDNTWHVRMQPPEEMASTPSIFMQDVYRWFYEYRKLEAMNGRRDLRTVTPESLMPYPGPWLTPQVRSRVRGTATRRALVGRDREDYLRILRTGCREADRYAQVATTRYLSFATIWPSIASSIWNSRYLQRELLSTGSPAKGSSHE